MATNWIVPTADMLPSVIQLSVIAKSNENIDADSIAASQQAGNVATQPGQPIDPAKDNRAKAIINLLVGQFREAVVTGGRFPLSVTPNSVPPTAARHVLNMAAFQLVSSGPSLNMVIMTEQGVYSPLQTVYKEGLAYLKRIEDGGGLLPPSDPAGIDGVNPIDANTNPPVTAVFSAPINSAIDLTMDGPLSGRVTRGTASPNGSISGNRGDVYEQLDAYGQVIRIWEKTGSYESDGWI